MSTCGQAPKIIRLKVSVLGGTMNLLQKLSEITADPLKDFSSQGPISISAVGRFLTLHQTVTHL